MAEQKTKYTNCTKKHIVCNNNDKYASRTPGWFSDVDKIEFAECCIGGHIFHKYRNPQIESFVLNTYEIPPFLCDKNIMPDGAFLPHRVVYPYDRK